MSTLLPFRVLLAYMRLLHTDIYNKTRRGLGNPKGRCNLSGLTSFGAQTALDWEEIGIKLWPMGTGEQAREMEEDKRKEFSDVRTQAGEGRSTESSLISRRQRRGEGGKKEKNTDAPICRLGDRKC